jgi:hypothetical protein
MSDEIPNPLGSQSEPDAKVANSAAPGSYQPTEAEVSLIAQPTIRGLKVELVDVERRKGKISELTNDEARAMAADRNARVAVLLRHWEESGDLEALFGALIFHQLQLPECLFKGLMQNFEQQFYNPHAIRFLAVRHAHDVLGKSMDESYDWASKNITDPAAKGRRDTMMKSYQKIRRKAARIDRIQRRSRTPGRPRQ